MLWIKKDPRASLDMLGFIPEFLSLDDPRPAREQINEAYSHGGGWCKFEGFKMLPNGNIQYPGDPPVPLLFESHLRQEIIRVYQHAWVAIVQPSGIYEIARLD